MDNFIHVYEVLRYVVNHMEKYINNLAARNKRFLPCQTHCNQQRTGRPQIMSYLAHN